MKTLLVTLSLALAGVSTASAQIYRPSVVGQTTVLGAVAGALIGGHNHDRWAQGAVIGAAAGAVLGAVVDDQQSYERPVVYTQPQMAPVVTVPYAPVVGSTAPQVIYVTSAPAQVVYVQSYAPSVVVARPVVYIGGGYGYRGYGRGYDRGYGRHYRHDRW